MNKKMNRREALRWLMVTATGFLVSCKNIIHPTPQASTPTKTDSPPTKTPAPTATATTEVTEAQEQVKVYLTSDISAQGLMRIYEALAREASGKVAVKISSGEPGGHYFLAPEIIAPLIHEVDGTIVECNTAYGGARDNTESHLNVMGQHGFTAIAPVDVMDAEGTLSLPIMGGTHLQEDVVGSHFGKYDYLINLAHFKGHAMAGFGGVIKNMSIGIAAREGKCLIHTAGRSTTSPWGGDQVDFLESMAEAAKGIADFMGERVIYINVMNNLSVDCDCDSSPAVPTMADVGILASLDPVAVDQACVDLVYAAPDGADLVTRIETRMGHTTLEHAEAIGLGSRQYELVDIG
jgi:hypothetical protein